MFPSSRGEHRADTGMGRAELSLTRAVGFPGKCHQAREGRVVEDECSGLSVELKHGLRQETGHRI